METLLNVSLPIFGLIACGYLGGRSGLLGRGSGEAINHFVYYFALPALLFVSVARAPVEHIFHGPFLLAWGGGLLVTYAIAVAVSRWVHRDRLSDTGLRSFNAIFSNAGYMGIPLAITAFGQAAALPAILATVSKGLVFVGLTVALVETDLSPEQRTRAIARDVAWALLRNPVLMSVIVGACWAATGWPLPSPVGAFGDLLGAAAGPSALFAMGLFIAAHPIGGYFRESAFTVFLKLVVHPAVTAALVLAGPLRHDPLWASVTIMQAALPTGATCFVLAQRYGRLVRITSSTIFLSTVLSIVTVSFLLFALERYLTP